MLIYVIDALNRFNHKKLRIPQDQPYPHVKLNYRAKDQYTEQDYASALLSKEDKKFIQKVTGTFLYYARAVDSTMIPSLGYISSQHANPTEQTMQREMQPLDYSATHPDVIITYRSSDMVLAGHINASYLSEANYLSRAGVHFFMTDKSESPHNNSAVITISQIIKAVMSSAAEAELFAIFINFR